MISGVRSQTRLVRGAALGLALAWTAPSLAQTADNPEMAAMFNADQSQRAADVEDHEAAAAADAQRRVRTRELLASGALKSGADFLGAAFIFQHGTEPRDYLLAHVLAVRAVGLGFKNAEWIAAATLDRYLQSVGQPQIYGTQFRFPDGVLTMEPYDRALLDDALRNAAGVADLATQERKLEEMKATIAASQP